MSDSKPPARSACMIEDWAIFYDNKLQLTCETLKDAQEYCDSQAENHWHQTDKDTYVFGGQVQTRIANFRIQKVSRFHWNTETEHTAYLLEKSRDIPSPSPNYGSD